MADKTFTIRTKRAYDAPAKADGSRILIDRVWPRGVSREDLRLDDWMKELAPSTDLRKWFGHDPDKWDDFRARYSRELDEQAEAADRLAELCRKKTVTLVYGARETRYNNAVALKEYLQRRLEGKQR